MKIPCLDCVMTSLNYKIPCINCIPDLKKNK